MAFNAFPRRGCIYSTDVVYPGDDEEYEDHPWESEATLAEMLAELSEQVEQMANDVSALNARVGTQENAIIALRSDVQVMRLSVNALSARVNNIVSVPASSASDNGKFLRVVGGVAAWQTVPQAEGVHF